MIRYVLRSSFDRSEGEGSIALLFVLIRLVVAK